MIYGPLSEALLDGRYRVGEVIGSGGFGTVYAAMHLGLAAKVAIKVPRIDDLAPSSIPEAIATFLEEGRTLKRLRHPNLVAALDVALLPPDEQGVALPYLVLEWCDGPTLREWRRDRGGSMAPDEVWALLRPAFEGIAHAHQAGVAHRDIKPANILLETSRDGGLVPRVIDFGIAKIIGAAEQASSGSTRTTSANPAYTPKYAAPEQLTGLRTSPRTDVYALALVLLETIRGEPVFATDDAARLAVVQSDLPTPRKLGLDLGSWNEPIERALSARPGDRFEDAGAFLRALGAAPTASSPPEPEQIAARASQHARLSGPTGPPRPSAAATPDDSFVPSSHTLPTYGAAAAKAAEAASPRTAIALGGVAAVLFAGFIAALLLFGLRPGNWLSQRAPRPSASAPPGSVQDAALRPLMSLTSRELVERAEAGGLVRCKVVADTKVVVQLDCLEGHMTLADHSNSLPQVHNRVWRMMEQQARYLTLGGKAARFTVDGDVGMSFAAPPSLIEGVVAHVLDGVRHENIGVATGVQELAPIAARLAQWRGPELATRIRALGGNIQEETTVLDRTTVVYRLDGKDAMAAIDQGDVNAFLASTSAPYAYAVDEGVAMLVKGDGGLGKLLHLQKVLGATAAARVAERR